MLLCLQRPYERVVVGLYGRVLIFVSSPGLFSSCCCVFGVLMNGLSSDSVVVDWVLFCHLDCFRSIYSLAGKLSFELIHFDLPLSLWAGFVSFWWTSLAWAGFELLLWCGTVFLLSNVRTLEYVHASKTKPVRK